MSHIPRQRGAPDKRDAITRSGEMLTCPTLTAIPERERATPQHRPSTNQRDARQLHSAPPRQLKPIIRRSTDVKHPARGRRGQPDAESGACRLMSTPEADHGTLPVAPSQVSQALQYTQHRGYGGMSATDSSLARLEHRKQRTPMTSFQVIASPSRLPPLAL